MPPNTKGGKGYKKGKHGDDDSKVPQWDTAQGQMLGRVLKGVGSKRFRVYCNDNKERLCKICGSMRKSEFVEKGCVVILGLRTLGTATTATSSANMELGDILKIIDTKFYGKLKKEEGINPVLFTDVEEQGANNVRARIAALGADATEDFFEHEDSASESGEEAPATGVAGNSSEQKKARAAELKLKAKERDAALMEKRANKAANIGDDINIDDI
jgi:translation initiation factor IF-1